jgi:hypothetical protein
MGLEAGTKGTASCTKGMESFPSVPKTFPMGRLTRAKGTETFVSGRMTIPKGSGTFSKGTAADA